MTSRTRFRAVVWSLGVLAAAPAPALAQGLTAGAIAGTVLDPQRRPVAGAALLAVHEPSGARYQGLSRADGRYVISGTKAGGPYTVTVTCSGFRPAVRRDVQVALGVAVELVMALGEVAVAEEVTVSAAASEVMSPTRTGAATRIPRVALASLPTIGDRLDDFGRLSPHYTQVTGGPQGGSYVGADGRFNNVTIDGAGFNTFGLSNQPGGRTDVTAIAPEALEEILVSVAPYDVRQGGFVGAGVNAVTRSGGRRLRAAAYYRFRDDGLVGRQAAGRPVDPGAFDIGRWGGWLSGPLVRDGLAFFASYENDRRTLPGTTYRANAGGERVEGNTTRVRAADLDALSAYLLSAFGYDAGPYQGYAHRTPAKRLLAKLDLGSDGRSKATLRYLQLASSSDELVSNSAELGWGRRRSNLNALNFRSSNYVSVENVRSIVGEWRAALGAGGANVLRAGYTHQDEHRDGRGSPFPMVDILQDGLAYTTFGLEPFTPANATRYGTLQLSDELTLSRGRHAITAGASVERFRSENTFFPGSQGIYVYSSLGDFYTDAEDYRANPARTSSPVTLRRFEQRWMNLPGTSEPVQPLRLWYTGLFAQDEWRAGSRFTLTYGLRLDVPFFEDTGIRNAEVESLTFRDGDGNAVRYRTDQLPGAHALWSPRAGFNWDVDGGRVTQLRGGAGAFTGRPAYVWISSQLAANGVLTGFERLNDTRQRPFVPATDAYEPAVVTGEPAASYDLALTEPRFRFPQVFRADLALDRRLPWQLVGTLEAVFTRDLNGVAFANVNLPPAQGRLAGADTRPYWRAGTPAQPGHLLYANITSAIVLGNEDRGEGWNLSASLARSTRRGFLRAAYAYGRSLGTTLPGAVGSAAWTANPQAGDPNRPELGYLAHGHRAFLAGALRFEYGRRTATTVSFFLEGRNAGNASYTYAGDLNGDGASGNDLLYVPRDTSEMSFQPYAVGGRTFTAEEQAEAWDAFIARDGHLSRRRGRYAERNGVLLPMVWRLDLGLAQDLFVDVGRRRHTLQLRADVLNLTNLLDSDWGVARSLVTTQPLTNPSVDAQGRADYRLLALNGELISQPLQVSPGLQDVYRVQLGLRYSFD